MKKIILTSIIMAFMVYGIQSQAKLKVTATGVGVDTDNPTVQLDIPGHSDKDNKVEVGSYGIASLNNSNGFLTHNCYFDLANGGSKVVPRVTGKGALAQFFDGRIIYYTVPNAAAGVPTTVSSAFVVQNNGNMQIGYPWNTPKPQKLEVNGNVAASGVILTSDKRLKTNVRNFDKGLKEIMSLNPISYVYNGKAGITDKSNHVGLFAQDLQKVAPELVTEFETLEGSEYGLDGSQIKAGTKESYLRINDTAIKYMLMNAIKEQQTIIEDKEKQINELADRMVLLERKFEELALSVSTGKSELHLEGEGAYLKQNVPNPFNGTTSIEYFIPADAVTAEIRIFNNAGTLVDKKAINEKGQGVLNLTENNLASGTYSYHLVVDGEAIATKHLIITR